MAPARTLPAPTPLVPEVTDLLNPKLEREYLSTSMNGQADPLLLGTRRNGAIYALPPSGGGGPGVEHATSSGSCGAGEGHSGSLAGGSGSGSTSPRSRTSKEPSPGSVTVRQQGLHGSRDRKLHQRPGSRCEWARRPVRGEGGRHQGAETRSEATRLQVDRGAEASRRMVRTQAVGHCSRNGRSSLCSKFGLEHHSRGRHGCGGRRGHV